MAEPTGSPLLASYGNLAPGVSTPFDQYSNLYPGGSKPSDQYGNLYPGGASPQMSVGLQQAPATGVIDAVGTLQAKVELLEMRLRRLEGKQ